MSFFEDLNLPQNLLALRSQNNKTTVIEIGGVEIGKNDFIVMAGPCAVESLDSILCIASKVKECGAKILRGGAFKPRTSPYSFQGLGKKALEFLKIASKKYNLPVVTEVLAVDEIDLAIYYADMLQVGSRNMQNFPLLKALGKVKKPILLKRGLSATIMEWLYAAEYILKSGNPHVILCERGIRTFETFTRNTLDLSAVAVIKEISHLPIIVDPSHATGHYQLVPAMAKAAFASGADGLMLEVHESPHMALSDGKESLNFTHFAKLMRDLERMRALRV